MIEAGLINIDKPADWTSHDVVAKIRSLLRRGYGGDAKRKVRVGHTGTLDPMATGVFPVCFGAATKISSLLMNGEKEYEVTCRLGLSTDTQDITGKVLQSCEPPVFSSETVSETFASFVGTILQTPPIFSAVKVGGRPLYKWARLGLDVERAPRPVTIKAIRLNRMEGKDLFLTVVCGRGTYIRTLCADIGAKLGVGGCVLSLRRTRSGIFSISDSLPLDRFIEEYSTGEWESQVYSMEKVLSLLPDLPMERALPAPVKGAKRPSAQGAREGEAPLALPMEGALPASVMERCYV